MSSHSSLHAAIEPVAASAMAPEPPHREPQALGTPQSVAVPAGVRLTRIRLRTGVEVQVAEAGAEDGEPVLFLHGYTDSWFSYSSVLPLLPPGIRAIALSQRGHGDSERPPRGYLLTDFAADAVALLDALRLRSAAVVGHSMGSFVAQRVAIDWPERVSRLVLIGSGPTLHVGPVLDLHAAVQTLTDPVPEPFISEFQESTVFEPLPPAFLAGAVAESAKLPAALWREVLGGILAADAASELHRIRAPTLVLWGERETFWTRPEQEGLLRAIPGARLVVYPDAAHSPQWERPERFVADLMAFLASPA